MNTISARLVAEYILALSNPDIGDIISNLKLQKLLYYAQGVHLAAFDTPLFEESITAWRYGPVVELVYHDYKVFGANAILQSAHNKAQELPSQKKEFLHQIYIYFGQFSAGKLMEMTHNESPWLLSKGKKIPQILMRDFFKEQAYTYKIAHPSEEEKLKNAASLLLGDYDNETDLTIFTQIDADDFYETK